MPALFRPENWPTVSASGLSPFDSTYVPTRKPIGTVLARIALLLVLFAVAMIVVAIPLSLCLSAWEATGVAIGTVLIYGGLSFFIRRNDGLGQGWSEDESTIHSVGRQQLWQVLYWASVPGRFAAETLLDACVLAGLANKSEVSDGRES